MCMYVKKKGCKQVMKKFLTKTELLGLPQKGLKQVSDLQRIALTFLIHLCSYNVYDKVN